MSNVVVERKAIELDCKLASLRAELDAWKAASRPKGELEKHNTQIRAVACTLDAPLAAAGARLAAAREQDLLAQALTLEMMVLELHRIWDFFREKLSLRYVDHFRLALIAADELAWRCYQPAQEQLPADVGREPPLVYLNGASSPLTLERGKRFEPESVSDEPLRWAISAATVQSLPVPVVGMPWFQVTHVPDAPILAHEVGHDVEIDLGLTDRIVALVSGAVPAGHRAAWRRWAGEVFADVYGALALGPAFATTLVDFLAGDPDAIAAEVCEPDDERAYPTTALRVLLAIAVLELTGFAADAKSLRDSWTARVPHHEMEDWETDLAPVARALVRGPYPQLPMKRLDKLVGFGPKRHREARADAKRLLNRMAPRAADARVLVAAARVAFDENPRGYVQTGAGARVVKRIKEKRDAGIRAGRGTGIPPELRAARDRAAGIKLLAMLDEHAKERADVQASHK